jgi:hypothetical protein
LYLQQCLLLNQYFVLKSVLFLLFVKWDDTAVSFLCMNIYNMFMIDTCCGLVVLCSLYTCMWEGNGSNLHWCQISWLGITMHSSDYPASFHDDLWVPVRGQTRRQLPQFKISRLKKRSKYKLNWTKTKLRGFSPQANYTDVATTACWLS